MSFIQFKNNDGQIVTVTASNPLPVSGGGGGGMTPEDITASAPMAWDAETGTLSIDLSGYAPVGHTHAAGDITSGTFAAARIPTLNQSKVSGLEAALSDLDARLTALEG